MPFTYQVITGKSLRLHSQKSSDRAYRPEVMCENSGINWGTLNMTAEDVKATTPASDDSVKSTPDGSKK